MMRASSEHSDRSSEIDLWNGATTTQWTTECSAIRDWSVKWRNDNTVNNWIVQWSPPCLVEVCDLSHFHVDSSALLWIEQPGKTKPHRSNFWGETNRCFLEWIPNIGNCIRRFSRNVNKNQRLELTARSHYAIPISWSQNLKVSIRHYLNKPFRIKHSEEIQHHKKINIIIQTS